MGYRHPKPGTPDKHAVRIYPLFSPKTDFGLMTIPRQWGYPTFDGTCGGQNQDPTWVPEIQLGPTGASFFQNPVRSTIVTIIKAFTLFWQWSMMLIIVEL